VVHIQLPTQALLTDAAFRTPIRVSLTCPGSLRSPVASAKLLTTSQADWFIADLIPLAAASIVAEV
jgi:hypothetical protein